MIAILLESRNIGGTSWAAARGHRRLSIKGMHDGDRVSIQFRIGGDISGKTFDRNGIYEMPDEVEAVRVDHIEISGTGRVSIDLV